MTFQVAGRPAASTDTFTARHQFNTEAEGRDQPGLGGNAAARAAARIEEWIYTEPRLLVLTGVAL
jgi:hypothetical protein